MKTLNELRAEALAVQDASNLCGVAQSFARAMIDLGEHTKGTDERNQHEVTTLWIDKLMSLNGFTNEKASKAFSEAMRDE